MAFTIEHVVAAPPEAVLDAIRRLAPYWRESLVPAELRKAGAFGVAVTIKGSRFRLYVEGNRRPAPTWFDLRGSVRPDPAGARVEARVGLMRGSYLATAPFGVIGLWVLADGSMTGLILFAMGLSMALVYWALDRDLAATGDVGARHLVERLDLVMREPSSAKIGTS